MNAYVDASPKKLCVICGEEKRVLNATRKHTNNEAEYLAIHFALNQFPNVTEIISDSQLAVKQLNGEYKIKEPRLQELASKVWRKTGAICSDGQLLKKGNVKFTWVRKEENPAGKALE